jgi:hypothetical protein
MTRQSDSAAAQHNEMSNEEKRLISEYPKCGLIVNPQIQYPNA